MSDAPRVEIAWIRRKLAATLRASKVTVMPATVDALAEKVWQICQIERASCALILAAAHDQYGPLDDDKIERVQLIMELHDEPAPGKCSIGGMEISRDMAPPKRRG